MATFSVQVVDLVGAFSDETALDTFITEGANEVINAMPRPMQERVAEETAVSTGTTTSEGHKVLYMLRSDSTIDQPCRRIPANKRGRAADSDDMEYATTSDPAYYVKDGKFNILPSGAGLLVSMPTYSQTSPLDASAISTITNFPNEAEYLVVLYAAVKALQQTMNSKSSSLPTDVTLPSAPVTPEIATVSYTDATNADATVGAIVVSAKIDISGNAPSFVSPVSSSADFAKVTSYVETDEDVELAAAKLQQIQSQISDFNAKIQESTNKFNKENVRYQMEFQEEVTKINQDLQAEVETFRTKASVAQFNKQQDQALNLANASKQIEDVIADNGSKLQKYASELQKYQAEVTSEIQNYSAKIQKHTTDYQWLIGRHQNLIADYQRGLQLLTGARAS